MAVYFKIRMQYKRKHDGSIIETTGRDVARPFLERCLVAKKGPAPSRILKGNSCTFTSTEFPLDSNCSIRLCEATSTDSTFVRGILMVLHGNSAHLRTFNTLLAEKAYSRRRVNDVSRQLHNTTNRSGSREAIAHDRNDLWTKLESEQAGYKALEQKLRCLNIGTLGLPAVSSKSYAVPPLSAGAANSYFDDSKASSLQVDIDEDEYFALIFLSSKHAATQPRKQRSYPSAPTDRIIQLFENGHLSRHPKEDYWEDKGLTYFKKTLEYFLDRGMPIQFCLPAFPCKSTNPRKTSSAAPDGAEHEAFHNLHQFCINLQDIYPPGADLIIVSDGHVFSDCIGTNDGDVYKYTEAIKELSDKIHASLSLCHGESPITFVNLNDVFHGPNLLLDGAFEIEWSAEDINRPIETTVDLKDENCRILMLRSCGFDAGMLDKATKDDENHSLTKVYRGFSRFMKDDLDDHPDFKDRSTSRRGDLANAVAKEMLKRNQAYSHLVELLHPRAIRLSIHQHKNHGPKFAINTLHKDRFKPIKKLEDIYSSEDAANHAKVEEAHIPTPWHNVLMEVEGHPMTYICKNGLVQDEKENPDSPYVCELRDDGRGARWYLKSRV